MISDNLIIDRESKKRPFDTDATTLSNEDSIRAEAAETSRHRAKFAKGTSGNPIVVVEDSDVEDCTREEEIICHEDDLCAICFEPKVYEANLIKGSVRCRHTFHTCCINKWLLKRRESHQPDTCPTCRSEWSCEESVVDAFDRVPFRIFALIAFARSSSD